MHVLKPVKKSPITLFPLTVRMNPMDIDWTSFRSGLGHNLSFQQLPAMLREGLRDFLLQIKSSSIESIQIQPEIWPRCRINGNVDELPPLNPETLPDAFRYTAWWLEWCERIAFVNVNWKCPECNEAAIRNPIAGPGDFIKGSCSSSGCPSHEILKLITDEAPVREAQTA
jgi:hypothetical protein